MLVTSNPVASMLFSILKIRVYIRHLQKIGNRKQGTGNPPLAPPPPRRGVIDNLWIIIDLIFDFYQMSIVGALAAAWR
ncbi:MAG: hypothetical protein F6K34_06860 [Okeania sp. SIO4D6]|uniref:hypothetical protein n=1 Tax=unclassified Okeania TaxID=2634635 RepID=UPI0013CA1A92|nr:MULTISPECIES: hypothetical protein [unclassified Okeania]NEP04570.1 hypothetical protein [Okeania sp. SIO4D6]